MDKKRIEWNIENLKKARELLKLSFDDLKNIEDFRESPYGCYGKRMGILEALEEAIALATHLHSTENES